MAPTDDFEFGIEKPSAEASNGETELIGRIFRGKILVGDIFRKLRTIRNHVDRPYDILDEKDVEVTIHSINAYGREFQEIDEGMTCLLRVTGLEAQLGKNSVLAGRR